MFDLEAGNRNFVDIVIWLRLKKKKTNLLEQQSFAANALIE